MTNQYSLKCNLSPETSLLPECFLWLLGVYSLTVRIHQHCTGFLVIVALRFMQAPQIEIESHLLIVGSLSPLYSSHRLFILL